jgi:Transcriptional regulators containing a DNA-binding HTH domain and an aminotransferase domain (MocR family) and their eukaryotic orthologs
MPDERKRELVEFLTKRDIPVIENGVYNELHYDSTHPAR